MFDYQQLKQDIIEIITQENNRPIPSWLIVKKLKLTNRQDLVLKVLDELVVDKKIYQTKTGCYCLNKTINIKPSDLIEGIINVNYSQSGFISLPNEKKAKYFVQKQNLNGALDGDTVLFYVNKQPIDKPLIDAIVFKVLKHAKDYFVCIYDMVDDKRVIKPDNEKNYLEIVLEHDGQIPVGSKILVKIDRFENNKAFGHLERIIGHKDDVGVDIMSIVYDNGVEPAFPQNIIDDVQKIKINIDEQQRAIRKDLTQLPIVTIDPATSKDFDDAIYVKKLSDNNYLLSVSIADVSHYVAYQSPLDEIALSRGCSIYLVDRVIPMLPHKLSDDLCSLVPNQERLTLTCDTIINEQGKVLDIKVYPSIINSHRRFSYDQVNAFFDKRDALPNDNQEIKTMLLEALSLHKILDNAKRLRGYIEFNVPKAAIKVDENCVPIQIDKYQSGTAQHMIEDFMVIANEAVTRYAKQKKYPFVYRIHDKPNIERLKTFAMEAKKLGFKITTDIETITSKDISR
jgi:ribonuclease R